MFELHPHSDNLISASVLYLGYFGDVVFAVSGALVAARHRMDIIGFMLLGGITGVGGGTTRDLILDRPVFWLVNPFELLLCLGAAVGVYLLLVVWRGLAEGRVLVWADALGLSAFAIQGAHISVVNSANEFSALFLGVLSAVGGGLMRDIICGERPFVLSGELYASAALVGAGVYLPLLLYAPVHEALATLIGFVVVFGLRGLGIVTGLRMGPPGSGWVQRS